MKKTMQQSQSAKRMDLAAWRASRVFEMDLPSGLHVSIRDVTMTDLILTGKLPPSVLEMADKASRDGAATFDIKEIAKNGAEFKVMLDALVGISLVEPQIGPDAVTQITLDELPNDDKMAIFNQDRKSVV